MLALKLFRGVLPGLFQRGKTAYFGIHANRAGALFGGRQAVGGKIAAAFQESRDDAVNFHRVNHWAVGSDAHNHIRLVLPRALIEAVQNIIQAAAKEKRAFLRAKISNRVVRAVIRAGHNQPADIPRAADAVDDALQHGFSPQVAHHFTGQAAGAHTRLDNREDVWFCHMRSAFYGWGVS